MRAILLVLILAVVAIIALVATGLVDVNQVRGARAPDVDATRNGVTASGGQTPAFDIETGSVSIGTRDANVKVPALKVNPAGNEAAAAPAPPTQNQSAATNSGM
ncbi:MAG: hypothetical protein ACR2FK_07070 [Sphingomicrobium sp.]